MSRMRRALSHAAAGEFDTTRHLHRGFRWIERGRGEPILLLHGLVGRVDDWSTVLERLAHRYRAIALRLPIFDSDRLEPSISALASYVTDFMDSMNLPRVILGGNSLGGHTALAVALRDRDRIGALVLTGSSGLSGTGVVRVVPRRLSREFLRMQIEQVFHDSSLATQELVESVRAALTPIDSLLHALRLIRAARRTTLEMRLHELAIPVLLLWGRYDQITPPDTASRFRALLPDAEVVLIDGCGHAAMLERPHAFASTLDAWLLRTQACRPGARSAFS